MNLFDVYSLWDIEPVRAEGCRVWDKEGREYLDLYGGHAVISIGHSHPTYVTSPIGMCIGMWGRKHQQYLKEQDRKSVV